MASLARLRRPSVRCASHVERRDALGLRSSARCSRQAARGGTGPVGAADLFRLAEKANQFRGRADALKVMAGEWTPSRLGHHGQAFMDQHKAWPPSSTR